MKAVVAILLALVACPVACHKDTKQTLPAIFEVPAGFTGWAIVEYQVPNAPALPDDGGTRVARVPQAGLLKTSSSQEIGTVKNQFFFVDAAGKRTPIDDIEMRPDAPPDGAARSHDHPVILGFRTGEIMTDTGRRVYEYFYVGPGPAGAPPPPPPP